MPKSCTGSRYTGYSCTSSRLRKVASAVTGPGVTTCRLVWIRPRSASTTKPVACAVVFHSVSKARVRSTLLEITLGAMRSSVTAQSGFSSTATAACAGLGRWPVSPPGGGGPGVTSGGAPGLAFAGGGGSAGAAATSAAVVEAPGACGICASAAHEKKSRHSPRGRRRLMRDAFLTTDEHDQPDDA